MRRRRHPRSRLKRGGIRVEDRDERWWCRHGRWWWWQWRRSRARVALRCSRWRRFCACAAHPSGNTGLLEWGMRRRRRRCCYDAGQVAPVKSQCQRLRGGRPRALPRLGQHVRRKPVLPPHCGVRRKDFPVPVGRRQLRRLREQHEAEQLLGDAGSRASTYLCSVAADHAGAWRAPKARPRRHRRRSRPRRPVARGRRTSVLSIPSLLKGGGAPTL